MDSFKPFDQITSIDKQHLFLQKMGGKEMDLPSHHHTLKAIQLHTGVPQIIRGQFNIARNMALYSYFFILWAQRCSSRPAVSLSMRCELRLTDQS